MSILQDVLYVLTDRLHKSAFKMHAVILQHMFRLVQSGQIQTPLWDQQKGGFENNQVYVKNFVTDLISQSFPNIARAQCMEFVVKFFTIGELKLFKVAVRDFLISLK